MKAEIKYINSPDIELEKFYPDEEDNFGFLLQLIVGPKDQEGEESFDLTVCTPIWLVKNHIQSDIILGRYYLIIFEYNYKRLYSYLKNYIENIEGKTWEEIALKLSKIAYWEFEGYRE